MAASSSSSSPSNLFAVWLYDTNFVRVALVDVPIQTFNKTVRASNPPLVSYLGNSYVWSNVHSAYFQVTPYAAAADNGQPKLSVIANPLL